MRGRRLAILAAGMALLAVIAGCGGGGAGAGGSGGGTSGGSSSAYAQKCAPANADARSAGGALLSGYAAGALADEKTWLRSYLLEKYLWYREMPSPDPTLAPYTVGAHGDVMAAWLDAQLTTALTPAGNAKDRFSFVMPSAEWRQLSEAGVVYGYGQEWKIGSVTPPRAIRVAYVTPGTAAALAGVVRGDTIVSVTLDGITVSPDAIDADGLDRLNAALYPSQSGRSARFRLQAPSGATRDLTLTSGQVVTQPVLVNTVLTVGASKVGYLVFNDFVLPSEGQLRSAFDAFRAAGIDDLVLDLRYNGGGYVYIASQIAYMVAGAGRTSGKVFERFQFNDKRAAETNAASNALEFVGVTSGIAGSGTAADVALPSLGLNRLIVLTTSATCSASESVVNGLRGIDFPVITLGSTSCGKPYGFTAKDNCGLSYFPVEFNGVNQKGQGDYGDGMAPTCAVADDLGRPLGDTGEAMLAAALAYRVGQQCPPAAVDKALNGGRADVDNGVVPRLPARTGKFLLP